MTDPAAGPPPRAVAAVAWIEVHLAHLAVLFAAAFLFGTRTQPVRTNWGDSWSDLNVQTSGRYFAETGFISNRFTPICDVGPRRAESLQYTHYPPLPDLINGLQQTLFGPVDIATYRILADLFALGSLFFFHRVVRSLWGPAPQVTLSRCSSRTCSGSSSQTPSTTSPSTGSRGTVRSTQRFAGSRPTSGSTLSGSRSAVFSA